MIHWLGFRFIQRSSGLVAGLLDIQFISMIFIAIGSGVILHGEVYQKSWHLYCIIPTPPPPEFYRVVWFVAKILMQYECSNICMHEFLLVVYAQAVSSRLLVSGCVKKCTIWLS